MREINRKNFIRNTLLGWFKKKSKKEDGVIRKPKEGWYHPDLMRPKSGDRVRIDCGEFGERDAIYNDPKYMFIQWRVTDCTHPLQNMNMADQYVMGWKPIGETIVTEDAQYEEVAPKLITN